MKLLELTEANTDALDALVLIAGPKALAELHRYMVHCGGRFQRRCRLYAQALDSWPMRGGHRYVIAFDDAQHDRSTLGYAINPWNARKAIVEVLSSAHTSAVGDVGYCVVLDDDGETEVVEHWFGEMAKLITERGVAYALEHGA